MAYELFATVARRIECGDRFDLAITSPCALDRLTRQIEMRGVTLENRVPDGLETMIQEAQSLVDHRTGRLPPEN